MNPTQIAAELDESLREICIVDKAFSKDFTNRIQSAIEKATEELQTRHDYWRNLFLSRAAHASEDIRFGSVGDMLCEHEDCTELATGYCAKHTPAHASEPIDEDILDGRVPPELGCNPAHASEPAQE